MQYWNKKGHFPADQNQNIDWDIVKLAQNLLTFDRKIQTTKQVSGFCGTGVNMKMWKYKDTDEYPLFEDSEENHHILRCKSTVEDNKWNEAIQALESVLLDNQTPKIQQK